MLLWLVILINDVIKCLNTNPFFIIETPTTLETRAHVFPLEIKNEKVFSLNFTFT